MILSFIPSFVRPILVVAVVVLGAFLLSNMTRVPEKTPHYGPKGAERLRIAVTQVRESMNKAANAPHPQEQLMHIQWAIAILQTARTLAGDDRALSELVEVDVVDMDQRLVQAERFCISQLEQS